MDTRTNPGLKLGAFALLLAAALGAGAAVGAAVGPIDTSGGEPEHVDQLDHGETPPSPDTTSPDTTIDVHGDH